MKKLILSNCDKLKRIESGQSLVELAVGLVVMVLLVSVIFDVSRMVLTYFSLQDAAEEGVVYGVGFPTDCNQIVDRIKGNLDDSINPDEITVAVNIERNDGSYSSCYVIPYGEVYAGKKMEIELSMDFDVTMPLIGAFIGQTIPLSATTNGVILRPQPPE